MAARRPYGSVFRRRLPGRGPGGKPRYSPGWYVRVRRAGREVRRFGGADRDTALALLEVLRRQQDRERLLGEAPESDTTLAAFVPLFLRYAEREWTPASFRTVRNVAEHRLVPHFGAMRLRDITPVHVEQFLARQDHVSGATRNRLKSWLSSIFRHAQDLRIVARNPALEVRRSAEPQTPLPLISLSDQQRLVDGLEGGMRLLVLTALETGMRLGELVRLSWRDVDLGRGTLQVRESKAKRPRLLALSARLRLALEAAAAQRVRALHGPELVLRGACGPGGSLQKSWRTAFKRAAAAIGHPDLRVHDLRHLTAINLVRAGLDLPTVQRVLGHASLLSTLRYADYADESAASRAARALDRLHARGGDGTSEPGR